MKSFSRLHIIYSTGTDCQNCKCICCEIVYKILGYKFGSMLISIIIVGDGTRYIYRGLPERESIELTLFTISNSSYVKSWAFYFIAILTTVLKKLAVFLLSDEAVKEREVVRLVRYTKPIRSCDERNRNDG